jgi:hypothetical protein
MFVMWRDQKHEVRAGTADLSARHHQSEMRGLGMLAARVQAMGHGCAKANLIATEALVDAGAQLLAHRVHRLLLLFAAPAAAPPEKPDTRAVVA